MKTFRILILSLLMCFLAASGVFADLTINLVAINGTDAEKEMDIKSYLPKELEPSDVVDAGSLKVEYDVDKAAYFVSGKVSFEPKESKTFKIKVKDVWQIAPEEIDILKQQVDANLKLLEKQPNFEEAQFARDKLLERMDFILAQQQNYSQDIERRIEQYRAYAEELKQIRNNIYSLDYLTSESKTLAEAEAARSVKFVIEVKNPSETDEKTIEEKHYLPKEIRLENVLDSKGFEVRFDEKKETAFLAKKETFAPGETKKYEIMIQDVWSLQLAKVEALRTRAQKAYDEIKDSLYAGSGQFLFDEIVRKVDLINESQSLELPTKEHIGLFRVNTKRYADGEDLVKKLEDLMAIVRAKKLEELESGKVKNVLQRLKALRGLAALSEALFKKKLSMTTVWRIIFATLGFVAFFTTLNFFIWIKRSGTAGEESGKGKITEVPKPTPPSEKAS